MSKPVKTEPDSTDLEILRLMSEGLTYAQVASRVHLCKETVVRRIHWLKDYSGSQTQYQLGYWHGRRESQGSPWVTDYPG